MTAHVIKEDQALNQVIDLLHSSGLPYKDITIDKSLMISYRDDNGSLIGSGGLEFYGSYALLRSVAVRKDFQGKSFGKAIINDLLHRAEAQGTTNVYLLTETAHDYFSRIGFSDVERNNVPQEIRLSSEFSNVCPVTAACMVYTLEPSHNSTY
jgi:amino-acid N-acetyltransferase